MTRALTGKLLKFLAFFQRFKIIAGIIKKPTTSVNQNISVLLHEGNTRRTWGNVVTSKGLILLINKYKYFSLNLKKYIVLVLNIALFRVQLFPYKFS